MRYAKAALHSRDRFQPGGPRPPPAIDRGAALPQSHRPGSRRMPRVRLPRHAPATASRQLPQGPARPRPAPLHPAAPAPAPRGSRRSPPPRPSGRAPRRRPRPRRRHPGPRLGTRRDRRAAPHLERTCRRRASPRRRLPCRRPAALPRRVRPRHPRRRRLRRLGAGPGRPRSLDRLGRHPPPQPVAPRARPVSLPRAPLRAVPQSRLQAARPLLAPPAGRLPPALRLRAPAAGDLRRQREPRRRLLRRRQLDPRRLDRRARALRPRRRLRRGQGDLRLPAASGLARTARHARAATRAAARAGSRHGPRPRQLGRERVRRGPAG